MIKCEFVIDDPKETNGTPVMTGWETVRFELMDDAEESPWAPD